MLCVPWELPPSELSLLDECLFVAAPLAPARHERLEAAKDRVGVFKAKYGDARWKEHVATVDPCISLAGTVPRPISRAYYKLVEIIRTSAIKPPTSSLHLCEAPGGFAQAVLSEFPTTRSASFMSRLEEGLPYFSPCLLHDNRANRLQLECNGDILQARVRDQIANANETYELVTGDGATDNDSQPELAESSTAAIVACEIEVAIRTQAEGGTFVVKIFGLARPITRQLVAILTRCYKSVSILKPCTSRSVNDERYVVCQGFCRAKSPNFRLPTQWNPGLFLEGVAEISDAWIAELDTIADQMAASQLFAIEKALRCTSSGVTSSRRFRGGRGHRAQTGGPAHPYRGGGRGYGKTRTS